MVRTQRREPDERCVEAGRWKGPAAQGHGQGRAAATSLSHTSKPTVCSEELRSPSLGETDGPLMVRRKMLHVEDAEGGRG